MFVKQRRFETKTDSMGASSQELDIEISDKKGMDNVAVDHLSRLENQKLEEFKEGEMYDNFPEEYLTVISGEEPWFPYIVNYLASDYLPKGLNHQQKKKFFANLNYCFWDGPYLFWSCVDKIITRCVFGREVRDVLSHFHSRPFVGIMELKTQQRC